MSTASAAIRLLALTAVLNVIRYVVGGPIEAVTIAEPMHRVMPQYPQAPTGAEGGRP